MKEKNQQYWEGNPELQDETVVMKDLKEHIINELGLSESDWDASKAVIYKSRNKTESREITVSSIEIALKERRFDELNKEIANTLYEELPNWIES